jgi:hypothetical protein
MQRVPSKRGSTGCDECDLAANADRRTVSRMWSIMVLYETTRALTDKRLPDRHLTMKRRLKPTMSSREAGRIIRPFR